jgi:acyl-CoA synthetase (NDP forming)
VTSSATDADVTVHEAGTTQLASRIAGNMRYLLAPGSVAIVGDTPGTGRGGWIHEALVTNGFAGPIYPVNPKYDEIRGLRAYPSLLDLPAAVDFVAVALGAGHAAKAIEQAASAGAKAALVIAAGFAEAGEEGRGRQEELRETALRHGIALCGPNCYGIANLHGNFAAYGGPLASPMRPGSVALLFQSGALTHSVTDPSVLRSTGYSFIVTTGNEAVTEIADYLELIAEHEQTRVIACFLEGLKSPSRFAAATRKAIAAGKRIVVLKVGRTELGQQAALSHTGAVAGEELVYDALFDRLGVIRVSDLDELIETVELLSYIPRIEAGNTAVTTISGGGAGMIADLSGEVGLPLDPFEQATRERLRSVLPAFAHPNNPLDVTGAVGEDPHLMGEALRALAEDESVSVIALAVNSPTATDDVSRRLHRTMTEALCELAATVEKPVVLGSISSGALDPDLLSLARQAGVPFLVGMRETLLAIARLRRASQGIDRHLQARATPGAPPRDLGELAGSWPDDGACSETESKRLLERVGLVAPRSALATTPAEAAQLASRIGFPVVLKVESPDVPHKTEVGGVRLGIADENEAERAFRQLVDDVHRQLPNAQIAGVSVQEQVGAGIDVLVGITNDPQLGPAIAVGLGGVFVEALNDVVVRMAPVAEEEAAEMIAALRAHHVFDGFRGSPKADTEALCAAVVRISELGWWLRDRVRAIDVNPLRVLPAGQGVRVLDALVIPFTPESSNRDTPPSG